jgi:hypothetical protein
MERNRKGWEHMERNRKGWEHMERNRKGWSKWNESHKMGQYITTFGVLVRLAS